MEDEKYERLGRILDDCNLSYRQGLKEGEVNAYKERVSMELQCFTFDLNEPTSRNGLMVFFDLMIKEMIPNVEEWKQRATRMGMETTQVDTLVDLPSNQEDAPPIQILKEEDHEPLLVSTCPNVDSWLESSMRKKHEAVFNEIEDLICKVNLEELDELEFEIDFADESYASCEEIHSLISYELQFERRKNMPRVEDTPNKSINLSSWHERLELVFQSIMMAVLRNWKKKKRYVRSFHLYSENSFSLSYSYFLSLPSVLEKRAMERKWWKKKKWREKCAIGDDISMR